MVLQKEIATTTPFTAKALNSVLK